MSPAFSGGELRVRLLIPIPAAYRGFPLEPDDDRDPDVVRLDLTQYGMPPVRIAFGRDAGDRVTAAHTDLGGMPVSLVREPYGGTSRRVLGTALGAAAAAGVIATVRRRHGRERGTSG